MKIVLASHSPRRQELLKGLGVDFSVNVINGIDESYPATMPKEEVAEHLAVKKREAYKVGEDELLITADTIVVVDDEILGKPKDADDARRMLHTISGRVHKVVTGVCLATTTESRSFSVTTEVKFRQLRDSEIDYYIERYKPFDKAGAYGIQEWIGYVGVEGIRGSYYNVMGFPVQRVYEEMTRHFGLKIAE
ncbi:Maf-like protein [uncultured Prevotella sp.]|uniref:Maf-like protein n=1 Tax=uncultured Prevotella sp. TaxID=159272 RepID=UPI0027E25176|nr:Maf-like protein [uncultured Prevotella sp.]